MTEKEIDDLVKEIMKVPKVESNNPVSTMYGLDVDTLINTLRDFKRLPTYDEVLKQNQKYKEVIDKAINYIECHSKFIFGKAERRFSDGKLECADGVEVFTGSPTKLLDILKEVK